MADPVTRYTLRHARFGANEILVADRNGELVLHTSYLQLQHERDCAIEDVKRLTLILAQVHALANPRLVLTTNGAEIVRLTGEFAPVEPEALTDYTNEALRCVSAGCTNTTKPGAYLCEAHEFPVTRG